MERYLGYWWAQAMFIEATRLKSLKVNPDNGDNNTVTKTENLPLKGTCHMLFVVLRAGHIYEFNDP